MKYWINTGFYEASTRYYQDAKPKHSLLTALALCARYLDAVALKTPSISSREVMPSRVGLNLDLRIQES